MSTYSSSKNTSVTLMQRWQRWITPRSTDPEAALQERIVRQISGAMLLFCLALIPLMLTGIVHTAGLFAAAFWSVMMLLAGWQAQRGHITRASLAVRSTLGMMAIGFTLVFGYWSGLSGLFLMVAYLYSIMLRRRQSLFALIASGVLFMTVLVTVTELGIGPAMKPEQPDGAILDPMFLPIRGIIALSIGAAMTAFLVHQVLGEFDKRTARLNTLVNSLESQVQARTEQLLAAAELGQEIAAQIDGENLMHEIVRLTTARFDLYGARLFIPEQDTGAYVQVAGINREGQQLASTTISPDATDSAVLHVAQTGQPLFLQDQPSGPVSGPHPTLTKTQSQMLLPLRVGDHALGVLALASDVPHFFKTEDQIVLSIVADQAAVALRNMQVYDTVRANLWQEIRDRNSERERMQQELIEAQQNTLKELALPVIPVMAGVIIAPLIGSIDSKRARDVLHGLLDGISRHNAQVVIIDVTGVPVVDSAVAAHFNQTIQAVQLKGARAILTGITDAVAEAVVDLGIDWSHIETVADLQTGLLRAVDMLDRRA